MTIETTVKQPDWKNLENLVVMIQKQLAPDANVQHNVKLDGFDSETKRQIDVLVEQQIGQFTMRIVIDCKDYSKPIDVKGVEEFHGLIQDVRAHKGALVCPSGFTKAALKRAQKLQIELYRPISTDNHKWRAKVTAPVLCDFRSCSMSFRISSSAAKPMTMPYDFYNLHVYDEAGNNLGTSLKVAQGKWNNAIFPSDVGEHSPISIFDSHKVYIDNGHNDTIEVEISVTLLVKQDIYLGHLPVDEINGLKDEHTGAVVTNAFTVGGLDPEEVERTWKHIQIGEPLEFQPLIKATGYYFYGVR